MRSFSLSPIFFAVLLVIAGTPALRASNPPVPSTGKVLIAYVGAYHGGPIQVKPQDVVKMTHINYAFANVVDGKMIVDPRMKSDSVNFLHLHDLKRFNPDLKILVSAGGWGWSGGFSDAVLTAGSRETFANSAIGYLLRFRLDGLDLDWEYPAQRGNDNPFRPEDKQNFTLVLERLRQKLDSLTQVQGRATPYLLTIATGANQAYIDNTELDRASQYLDYVNIMTYDFRGSWSDRTGHHSNLYDSKGDPDPQSTHAAVLRHIRAGVPREKIVVGAAFYGRAWKDVEPVRKGLHQKQGGTYTEMRTGYAQLAANYADLGFRDYWDRPARASYLWNRDKQVFVTYESPKAIRLKANYVIREGLAGCMFWQYYSDESGVLLDTLHKNLNEK
jgi:chitinase